MQGIGIYDIIILALAVFLGWRLFSVLGHQEGDDAAFGGFDAASPDMAPVAAPAPALRKKAPMPKGLAPGVEAGLAAIADADGAFDPVRFLSGARRAYTIIVEAFSTGDVATLKPLLGDDIYEAFVAAIRQRAGACVPVRVEEVVAADLADASCDGREARVTVRFRSRQAHGPEMVDASDLWTFRRLVRQEDPNWILVQAREAQD